MNSPLSQSIKKLDSMIDELEADLGAAPMDCDPDEYYSDVKTKAQGVRHIKCARGCGYILTSPFELRCPSCGFKDKNKVPAFVESVNLDMVINGVKSMKTKAATPTPVVKQAKTEQKKEETKAKPTEAASPAVAPEHKEKKKPAEPKAEEKKEEAKVETKTETKAADVKKEEAKPVDKETVYAEFLNKASLKVAKILTIQDHPSADKLYLCSVDVGAEAPKQLIAGLRGRVPADQLQGSLIVTITNLKPAKLVGLFSEVMLLAATHPEDHNNVKALIPPEGSVPGDRVYLQGRTPIEASKLPKECKSKVWASVVEVLHVQDSAACVADLPLVTERGTVKCNLPNGSTIH